MNPARTAELLDPFLRVAVASPEDSKIQRLGHSEPAKAGEARPEHGRKPALSLLNGESAVLSPAQLQNISTYIDILLRWNARINLTAIRDPEDIVTRHFGESLFAARLLFPAAVESQTKPAAQRTSRERHGFSGVNTPLNATQALAPEAASATAEDHRPAASTLADLGSGAGFPGLPIKLWAPHVSLTLIESNHKKAAFLREVTRALTLTDVNIQNTRAESLTATFNLVTLRAVERFESILPTASALLAPAGRLALLISAAQQDQARTTLPHLAWSNPIPVPHSRSRIVLVGSLS